MADPYTAIKLPPKILNIAKSWPIVYDWYKVNSDTLSNSLAINEFDTVLKKINDSSDSTIATFQDRLKRKLTTWKNKDWIDPNSRGLPR
jgi:hypothetical protein